MSESDKLEQAQQLASDYAYGLAAINGDMVGEGVGEFIQEMIQGDPESLVKDLTEFMVTMAHSDVHPHQGRQVLAAERLHADLVQSMAHILKDSPTGLNQWFRDQEQEQEDIRGEERARRQEERRG